MKQRLQHTSLERLITEQQTLSTLLGGSCDVLRDYCVADYVGNPALKQEQGVNNYYARGFFADQGAWRETLQLEPQVSLAIFATFLVVEINAGTDTAEFLVLVPDRKQEGGMYLGLMKSHNTDVLREQLVENPDKVSQLSIEVSALLQYLRQPEQTQAPVQAGWLKRIFMKQYGERE